MTLSCHYRSRRLATVILTAVSLSVGLIFLSPTWLQAGETYPAKVTLLKNREYGDELITGIRNARTSIFLSFYLFKTTNSPSNLPAIILTELIRASKRGVDVSVLLEASADGNDRLNSDNRHTAALLTKGGIRVFFDSPRITTHTKVVVIDNRYVFLGSHNLTQGALQHNNELSLRVDSPELAREIRTYLDRL